MLTSKIRTVIDHLRNRGLLPDVGAAGALTDGELLGSFIDHRDEVALAVLVRRHGAMVWGVCRRLLSHHDAEDAFQAAFLVLVRKATSVSPRELVGNWLYGVARQTALQARRTAARRRAREVQVMQMPEAKSPGPDEWPDLLPILDEELDRLPDKYRAVIVLCELEGRTRKEVARQLRVPEGTVAGRLARARATLAKRLRRRGVTLSSGTLAAALAQNLAAASVPNSVMSSAVQAATLVAKGQTAATGAISVKVAALTDGVLKVMLISKLKSTVAIMVALGALAIGATVLTLSAAVTRDDPALAAEKPGNAPEKQPERQNKAIAKEPITTAQHRFTVHLTKLEPWPKVPGCAFLDNDRILVQAATSVMEIRDAKNGKVLKSIGLKNQSVGEFRLTPDRKSVAAVTIADTTGTFVIPSPDVTVWDTTTWKVRGTVSGHRLLDLAADGRTVLVRDDDGWGEQSGKVAVWDVVANKKLKTSPFEFKRFDAAAFSPDGSLVAVSGLNEIAYWKWREDGEKFDRLKVGRTVGALVFSPDGKLVAEGPAPRMNVELRDVATLKVVQTLADPGQPQISFSVSGMAFADSGKTLVLGNGIGLIETIPVPHRIHLWDVTTGKLLQKIALKGGMPYSLDVSPDGTMLAAVTADAGVSLRVFDLGRDLLPGADRTDSPAALGPVPKGVDDPMWMVEFRWAYGLRDGELIRRVAPPYPAWRAEYFKDRIRELYKRNKQEAPPEALKRDYTEFFTRFAWKDRWTVDDLTMQTWPVKPDEGVQLAQLIRMTTGFPRTRTEGDAELLQRNVTGDFVVRADADPSKLAAALEMILRKECGLSVSLAVREVERKVHVLSGTYESKPLPERMKHFIEIYGFELADRTTGGGGSGSLQELADNVEGFIEVPVVVGEVEGAPRRVEWHFNYRSPATAQERAQDADPESVLKNITAQTGLTAKQEERKVKVLTIKKAG